jgi:hypothetical protein
MKKQCMKASELVSLLQKRIAEHGDLEISVDTQDGAAYSLYGEDDVKLTVGHDREGREVRWLEIG